MHKLESAMNDFEKLMQHRSGQFTGDEFQRDHPILADELADCLTAFTESARKVIERIPNVPSHTNH